MVVWHYGFQMVWNVDPITVLLCTVEKQNRFHPQTKACKLDQHPSRMSNVPLHGLWKGEGGPRSLVSKRFNHASAFLFSVLLALFPFYRWKSKGHT